jgi:hypothetical protein
MFVKLHPEKIVLLSKNVEKGINLRDGSRVLTPHARYLCQRLLYHYLGYGLD